MFYQGINEESKSILDLSAEGRFMSLTIEYRRELIERIVSAQEQQNIQEPAKPTGNIHHIEDI